MTGDAQLHTGGWRISTTAATFWVLAAYALVYWALLLTFTYPPIQDYPNHLLRQEVLKDPTAQPYSQYLGLESGFKPNLLADWLLSGLTRLVSPATAGKALLCLEQLVLCFSIALFLSTFGASVLAALLAGHLVGSWVFLKGLINFGFGLGLGLLWLSWLFAGSRRHLRYWLVGSLLGIATVATHGFAFLAFSALIAAAAASRLPFRGPRALLPATTVLPGSVLFLVFLIRRIRSAGLIENELVYSSGPLELLLYNPLVIWLRSADRFDIFFGRFGWFLIGLAWVWVSVLLWRRSARMSTDGLLNVVSFASASIILYLALPDSLTSGWGFIKFRMAVIILLVSLPMLNWLPLGVRRLATTVVLIGAILGVALSIRDYHRFDSEVSTYMTMADAVPTGSVVLSLNLKDRPGSSLRPYQHVWAYMCLQRRCMSQEIFAEEYAHPIYFKRDLTARGVVVPPYDRQRVLDALGTGEYDALVSAGHLDTSWLAGEPSWHLAAHNESGSVYLPESGSESRP